MGERSGAQASSDLPPGGGARLRALLGRAARRVCPNCGEGDIWTGWFSMKDRCPRCRYRFEREEGYFLGAMAVNLLVAEFIPIGILIVLFVWTDLSWIALEAIVIPLALGLPILFYPFARTFWMAIDLMITPKTEARGR